MKTICANMDIVDESRAYIQHTSNEGAGFDLLRLDVVHPVISGNKWFKLKLNLRDALDAGFRTVLTFGGAHSNHLVATAAACEAAGMSSIGMVRGIHGAKRTTATLEHCSRLGMKLHFLSRQEYAQKNEIGFQEALKNLYPHSFNVPEGVANEAGRGGAALIAAMIPESYTHICVSVGTGTTLAGLRKALPGYQQVLGFAPMKHGCQLTTDISSLEDSEKSFLVFDKWHFGGFAKYNEELIAFMNAFYDSFKVPLDMVYTAKMIFGVQTLIKERYFPREARILCVHTGGLQGNAVIKQKLIYRT